MNSQSPPPAKRVVDSVVKPTILSHGTLECRDLAASRRFYEEFLGLECVRHGQPAMLIRKGGYWCIVCVGLGKKPEGTQLLNHWGIDVATMEEVDDAYKKAIELKDVYGIQAVTKPGDQHGVYSFYLQDLDGNWREIQKVPDGLNDKMYVRGDVVKM